MYNILQEYIYLINWPCVTYNDNISITFCDNNENIIMDVSIYFPKLVAGSSNV